MRMIASSSSVACRSMLAATPAGGQRQARCVRVEAQDKGFSGGQGQKLPKQIKASKWLCVCGATCSSSLQAAFQASHGGGGAACCTASTPTPAHHLQKSKRGKVSSRPSPKLTLEQLQAEQEAYEASLRQRQTAAGGGSPTGAQPAGQQDSGDDDPEIYLGSGSGGRTVEYGNAAAVPEVVTNRMLRRVILFMGTPVFGGIALFPFFYWLKVRL